MLSEILWSVASKAGDTLLSSLLGDSYNKVKSLLVKDEIIAALDRAFISAIESYAALPNAYAELLTELKGKKGALKRKEVQLEFLKLLSPNEEPDCEVIAQAIPTPSQYIRTPINVHREVEKFIGILLLHLRKEKALIPNFQALDTKNISDNIDLIALQTETLEGHLIDQKSWIHEQTNGFKGREWLFNKVNRFIFDKGHSCGYFFIMGDPGIGKSALAGKMIQDNLWVHHLNLRRESINRPEDFLKNVCAQLIINYKLNPRLYLPIETENARTFVKIIDDVSKSIVKPDVCIIVIDALDEIQGKEIDKGSNPLYLPRNLQDGIFVIATLREDVRYLPAVSTERKIIKIKAKSSNNKKDVEDFLRSALHDPGLIRYCQDNKISSHEFVYKVALKSEYNFMYLRQVLPLIAKLDGLYNDIPLSDLPTGLKDYYRDHWSVMKKKNGDRWYLEKLPVIVSLSLKHGYMSTETIQILASNYYEIVGHSHPPPNQVKIRNILKEWLPFLHTAKSKPEGESESTLYRLYHESFYDFIREQGEIREERLELAKMNTAFTDLLLADYRSVR